MEANGSAQSEHLNGHAKPLFLRSLHPMLVADDARRIVDANAAACLFLRLSPEEVCELTIDDLSPSTAQAGLAAAWEELTSGTVFRRRTRTLGGSMKMPDGQLASVDITVRPKVRPGRHLAIVVPHGLRESDERLGNTATELTAREREILTLVACGLTGVEIAARLFLAPTTVQTHVTNALLKLGARNRAHGVAIAVRCNQLDVLEA